MTALDTKKKVDNGLNAGAISTVFSCLVSCCMLIIIFWSCVDAVLDFAFFAYLNLSISFSLHLVVVVVFIIYELLNVSIPMS